MAKPLEKNLTNVNIIGSEDNPVQIAYIRRVIGCENLSYDPPDIPVVPETETPNGMAISKTDNKFTFKEITTYQANIAMGTNYINGNGTNTGLNFPGGAGNAKITGTFQATGLITANNGINVSSANIQINSGYFSPDGTNKGIFYLGTDTVYTTGSINVGNAIQTNGVIQSLTYMRTKHYEITDGIVAPGTTFGIAKTFVDQTDGNYKIKFGNGIVKTIATNP